MEMKICFDMDGTIANFYGVDGWLDCLEAYDPTPYMVAKPLVNMSALARQIHRLQKLGWEINIISWLSKTSTEDFDSEVAEVKMKWLKKHLPSVDFSEIHIVPYGTPKSSCGCGILFDDEERNRDDWENAKYGNLAFDVDNLLDVLRLL